MAFLRAPRLLLPALFLTFLIFYMGFWHQPFLWDASPSPVDTQKLDDSDRTPPGAGSLEAPAGLGKEKTSGSVPPPASDQHASHSDTASDEDYDYTRPTSVDEAGYPVMQGEGVEVPTPNPGVKVECDSFETYLRKKPDPKSEGFRKFPLVRPPPECRTFTVPAVEEYIQKMEKNIKDPDLYRLFQNSFPNTLDTMIKWHGYARKTPEPGAKPVEGEAQEETDEELSYIITGDIDAMWLRDSASQLYSYLHFLEPSTELNSLASLWRGLINSHSRYIIISPYCHSFQPPSESGIRPTHNGAYSQNNPQPPYDPIKVFDCKWELDSLASFLQVSVGYYAKTGDLAYFQKYNWIKAVESAYKAALAMRVGTYDNDGKVLKSAWTFTGWTNRGSETLTNDGIGNPTKSNGMVRTAFRPSDDATIFQLLTPANMMWAKYLEEASLIMEKLQGDLAANLTVEMRDFAYGIRKGIDQDAIVKHRDFGEIFAYECDGYGGVNLMDDSNIPSLLSMPLFNYSESSFELPSPGRDYAKIYQNTRRFILSDANPYYAKGPILSAVGGPHLGPGKGWPMAAIVAAMTAFDPVSGPSGEVEGFVAEQLGQVLNSTSGAGVVHESVNAWNGNDFTRAWFGWANGLLGELVVKIEEHEVKTKGGLTADGLLGRSWQ